MIEQSQYLGFLTVVTVLLLGQADSLGECPSGQYADDGVATFNIFIYTWTESLIWLALLTSIISSFVNVFTGKEPNIVIPTACTIIAVISYWINWFVLTIVDYIYNIRCLTHSPSASLNRRLYVAQAIPQLLLLTVTIVYLTGEASFLNNFLKEKASSPSIEVTEIANTRLAKGSRSSRTSRKEIGTRR
jgi:hypothetical protein